MISLVLFIAIILDYNKAIVDTQNKLNYCLSPFSFLLYLLPLVVYLSLIDRKAFSARLSKNGDLC